MAIILQKTLQSISYTLYVKTEVTLSEVNQKLYLVQNIYQSKSHFTDDFLPIIRRRLDTGNANIIRVVRALIAEDRSAAILAIETFLVQNIPYYTGGVVENGVS